MAFAKLIAFDRPLAGAVRPGTGGRFCTEADLAAQAEESYRRGVDAARASADQQMVEFRADVEALGDGVFNKIAALEASILGQLREALPGLTLEIAQRLLAGYEPPPAVVSRICEEALAGLFPERENLELMLAPRDLAFLEQIQPAWISRFPGLKLRADSALAPGDCQIRSRFGLTDARRQTKLAALATALQPV